MEEAIELIEKQIHIMKVTETKCFCDRCETIKDIIEILKENL